VTGPDADRVIAQIEAAAAAKNGGTALSHGPHGSSPVFKPHGQNSKLDGHSFNLNKLIAALVFPTVALAADAASAYGDYFLDAAASGSGPGCWPGGGPPGGDELAGQFVGGYGALNRK
jgi:hypothetical protein